MMHLQESARDKHVYDASKAIKKEERADSPNLVIKQEPLSDVIVDTALKSLFRTVTENGREVFELLDSDEEMELADLSEDRGMSSDLGTELQSAGATTRWTDCCIRSVRESIPHAADTPYFYIEFSGVGVASVHAMQHCDSIGYGFWVGFFWNSWP